MDLAVNVLSVTCIANLTLGLFILSRNPRAATGQSFFAMSVLISAWATSNFLTDYSHRLSASILFNKLSYFFGFLALFACVIFSHSFTQQKDQSKRRLAIFGILAIAMSLFSLTSYIAGTVTKVNGELSFTIGRFVLVYDIAVLIGFLLVIKYFIKFLGSSNKIQRNQARIIAFSFGISIVIGMLTNVIIPAISNSFQTTKLGPPLLSLCLITSISYAIVKHQLFDIRPVVARAVAYILALFTVAAVYSAIVFGIARNLFAAAPQHFSTQLLFVVFTITAALIFQPLKAFFDKFTNSIFFRDAYDPQVFLDELNTVLVSNLNIDNLLNKSSHTITTNLKPAFCVFIIRDSKTKQLRFFGKQGGKWLEDTTEELLRSLPNSARSKVIMLEKLAEESKLRHSLQENSLGAVVKLGSHSEVVGYMLLGEKQSGNPYSHQDERMLDIIADELVIAIQNSLQYEEISRFNITLQQKIDDATKELRHANTRLKALDEAKDEFISMASHQLRTPLTVIKGYLSMLQEGDIGHITKDQQDVIQKAFDGAERMTYIIGDLLNVSRLQAGKFQIENNPVNLPKIVEGEVAQLQKTASAHNLTLKLHKPESFPTLMLDEGKMRQVIMNFIDNAIYYTPKGGNIEVQLDCTDKDVALTVSDNGMGVPKAEHHHLFTKFYRAGNARKARPDGTGLGLYMAKKIIVAQGGAVIFKSIEGKGSVFGFSFPRSAVEQK